MLPSMRYRNTHLKIQLVCLFFSSKVFVFDPYWCNPGKSPHVTKLGGTQRDSGQMMPASQNDSGMCALVVADGPGLTELKGKYISGTSKAHLH